MSVMFLYREEMLRNRLLFGPLEVFNSFYESLIKSGKLIFEIHFTAEGNTTYL